MPAAAGRTCYILAGAEVTTLNELVQIVAEAGRREAAIAAPAGVAVLDRRARLRGRLRAVRARAARSIAGAWTSSRRAARSTSRARGRRSGIAPRHRSGAGRQADARLVPLGRVAVMARTAFRGRRTSCFAGERVGPRRSTRALIIGRPGWGALIKYELVQLLSQWVPGALGLVLRKVPVSHRSLGACGRNVVFGQSVVLRHPHKIRHRRQHRHRRQLPARRQGRGRTPASASATASSSGAIASSRARTATSSSATAPTSGSTARCFRRRACEIG